MFTSVDIGSHSIKIVVSEKINDKYFVLASTSVRSQGIKKGFIKDKSLALTCLKKAISNINGDLGIDIKDVLLTFPLYNVNTSIETGETSVNEIVTGMDIQNVIKNAIAENISETEEVVYVEPIVFEIDSGIQVVDPKSLTTNHLSVRLAVSTIEKDILYPYLELLHDAGLNVYDLSYGIIGDYFEESNKEIDKALGAVVNIGYGKTEIGIFNKGILLKGICLPYGSSKIDKDISYIYKIDRNTSCLLKENFANASYSYADKNDVMEVVNVSGDKIDINQLEISQIVEARIKEMLKNVKNEINNLTNRKISYIIITGGITNIAGFAYLLDNELDYEKIICNMTTLGIRSNTYSTSFGLIKYFDEKMKFRDIDWTMFSEDTKTELTAKKNKVGNQEHLIQKFEAYLKN